MKSTHLLIRMEYKGTSNPPLASTCCLYFALLIQRSSCLPSLHDWEVINGLRSILWHSVAASGVYTSPVRLQQGFILFSKSVHLTSNRGKGEMVPYLTAQMPSVEYFDHYKRCTYVAACDICWTFM